MLLIDVELVFQSPQSIAENQVKGLGFRIEDKQAQFSDIESGLDDVGEGLMQFYMI